MILYAIYSADLLEVFKLEKVCCASLQYEWKFGVFGFYKIVTMTSKLRIYWCVKKQKFGLHISSYDGLSGCKFTENRLQYPLNFYSNTSSWRQPAVQPNSQFVTSEPEVTLGAASQVDHLTSSTMVQSRRSYMEYHWSPLEERWTLWSS